MRGSDMFVGLTEKGNLFMIDEPYKMANLTISQ